MAITGTAREPFSEGYVKKVGLAVTEVLGINPTKKELEQILDRELEHDPEYLKRNDNNQKQLNLEIWLKEVRSGNKFKLRMRPLSDEVHTLDSGKVRYIDIKGNTSYFVDNVQNLASWMQENAPRKAKVGEIELFKFLRAYQGMMKGPEITDFTIDWDRLMRGDVSELAELKNNSFVSTVLVNLCVRVDKKDGVTRSYQNVYNAAFLPGDFIRYFRNKGLKKNSRYDQFINDITDPKNGCRDFFGADRILREIHDYVPSENPLESDSPVLAASTVGEDGNEELDSVEISTDY